MPTILGVTLARGGSRGCKRKHTRLLGDKPVLAWTIEAAKASKHLTNYIVSSDNLLILQIAVSYGVNAIKRPHELAHDDSPTLPALQHAVDWWERQFGKVDYVIEIRATSPLKTTVDIDGAIELLLSSGAESVIGVTPLEDHHPARAKWLDQEGRIQDFLPEPASGRRQDLTPKAYIRNGTIYAFRREAVMPPHGRLFGHVFSMGYVMPPERSVNIDTELDLLLCEAILRR